MPDLQRGHAEFTARPPENAEYLGDGAYASFDGMHVLIWAERENGWNYVALEPSVWSDFKRFAQRHFGE